MRLRTAVSSLVAAALLLTGCSGGGDAPSTDTPSDTAPTAAEPDPPEVPGMVVLVSDADLPDTVDRLEEAIGDIGSVTATIDHADAAEGAGLDLDPTVLVIGGSPEAGTPILQDMQAAGLDLPQKYVVWEAQGVVYLGYNSVDWIAQQAGIDRRSDDLDRLRYGSSAIAAAATGAEPDDRVELAEDEAVAETTVASDAGFEETVSRLQAAFEDAGLRSPATVDHAAGAQSVGAVLRATTVTFAGDPEANTPLLVQAQSLGLDLPLRFLVTEGADGTVSVTYPDVVDLAARHGVDGADAQDALDTLVQEQEDLTAAATGDAG